MQPLNNSSHSRLCLVLRSVPCAGAEWRGIAVIHAHTYMYVRIHAHTYMHVRIHAHTYMHACTHTRTHIHACTDAYTHTHTCLHVCTHTRTHIHACTHTRTHMNAQMHTVLAFLTNRDAFVFGCNHDCPDSAHVPSVPTYVECSCLCERWLPHQGGPHLPHSVRHTLICVWRHRRARGEAPVHAHTYIHTEYTCVLQLCTTVYT